MRLIDADALHERAQNLNNKERRFVQVILSVCPTIDAVPVVRCKDCSNTTEVDGYMGTVLYCHVCDRDVDEEHFCSYGKRKDGDG